jgi:hypothetical protein
MRQAGEQETFSLSPFTSHFSGIHQYNLPTAKPDKKLFKILQPNIHISISFVLAWLLLKCEFGLKMGNRFSPENNDSKTN